MGSATVLFVNLDEQTILTLRWAIPFRLRAADYTVQVSNAKQVATFYAKLFGMKPFAYRGLETNSRSVVSHVVKQNDIVFQFESALEPNNNVYGDYLTKHGDAVKDIAFAVENIEHLVENIKQCGGKIVQEVTQLVDKLSGGSVKVARVNPYGDFTHTLIERGPGFGTATTNCFMPNYGPSPLEVSIDQCSYRVLPNFFRSKRSSQF